MRESSAMRNGTPNSAICLLALLIFGGCRKLEVPKEATDALREVTTEMQTKDRVQIQIRATNEEPTAEDLQLRRMIEDKIDQEHVGRLVSSGAGGGYMDITVEVDNTAMAIPRLRVIAQSAGALSRSSFKVLSRQ